MIEILKDLDVLKTRNWMLSDIQMAGVAFGSDVIDFPRERVTEVTLAPIIKKSSWDRDTGSKYYDCSGDELSQDQVIEDAIQNKGILHFVEGISFKIEEKKVLGFAIYGGILRYFDSLKTYENCLKAFGRPDRMDRKEAYGDLMGYNNYYTKHEMLVSWDSWDERISLLNLGNYHTKRV